LVSELGWPSGAIKRLANGLGWPKSNGASSVVSRETSLDPAREQSPATDRNGHGPGNVAPAHSSVGDDAAVEQSPPLPQENQEQPTSSSSALRPEGAQPSVPEHSAAEHSAAEHSEPSKQTDDAPAIVAAQSLPAAPADTVQDDHAIAYPGAVAHSELQPLVDADPEYPADASSVNERHYATADAIGSRVGSDQTPHPSALPEVRMSTSNEQPTSDPEPSTISVSVTRPWLEVEPTGFRHAQPRPQDGGAGAAPALSPVTGSQPLIESISLMDDSTPLALEVAEDTRRRISLAGRRFPRPKETRVITVSNQKGGVGKTTTTVNIAGALAQAGLRVLVLDIDPQGNASTALGIDHHAEVRSVYDVLVDSMPLAEAIQPCPDIENLWCAPATIDLAGAEIELVSLVARESRLQRAVSSYLESQDKGADRLDYILVDCPPSLGLLTVNAFVAAQEVLIPIQCEYYALEGLSQLLRNVELIKGHLNPALHVSTILLTMYDGRTRLSSQVADEVRAHFPSEVLRTTVPRSVRISEAPSHGQTVMTYDPASSGALSYLEAARELAEQVLGVDGGATPNDGRP
jgi:chromosome partitioning protein